MFKRAVSMAVVALAAASAGCSAPFTSNGGELFDRAVVPASEVRLGDAVMAFFVGPQRAEMSSPIGQTHKPGYLVLVNADGSFRAVKTKRMDMMKSVWSRQGLYFADEDNDYRLTASGLTKTANPKTTAQNLMFALPDGGAVGVYNDGHDTDGGYTNHVAVSTDGMGRVHHAQGNYFTGARCDDQVFGIAENPGNHRSQAPRSPGWTSNVSDTFSPHMLARLHPMDSREKVIGWRQTFGSTPGGEVPCHDGVITFLSWDTDANDIEQPNIVSWDTATGRAQTHALTFDDGTAVNREDFGYVKQDWHDGRLHWVYADGRVFSTDSSTGKTTTLFSTAPATGASRPVQTFYAFTDTELHALSTFPGAEGDLTYTVLNRANGQTLRRVSVPIPNTEVNVPNLNLSYLTVRPTT